MIGSAVAKRYARALFELASEEKNVEQVGKALDAIAAAYNDSAELRAVLASPAYAPDSKKAVVAGLAQRVAAPKVLVSTLALLSDRGRLPAIVDIAHVFGAMAEEKAGRIRAEVITAQPLSEDYYRQLEQTLSSATGKKVTLVRRQDPSLIGGVVTRVQGTVFDGSLRARLKDIRHQMLVPASPQGRV